MADRPTRTLARASTSRTQTGYRRRTATPASRAKDRPRPITAAARLARLPSTTGVIGLVVVLCIFGLVMVGSASPVVSMVLYGTPWTILEHQVMWMIIGSVAFLAVSRLDYHLWSKFRIPLLVGTTALLVMVLVPGVGVASGGSSRWIGFGQFRIQPSELMKLALVVFVAELLTRRAARVDQAKAVIVPVVIVLGISSALIIEQPDMGTAMVLSCIALGILFMGGVPMRSILRILVSLVGVAVVVGLIDPYRRARILSFLNPGAHQTGSGYQVWQSLIGLGSGGTTGLGLGGGTQNSASLPNSHTDFIFSVVGNELGLLGAVVLLGLFFLLAWYGLRVANRAPDRFGSLMATGITVWIVSQAVINIGAVIGVLPVTGIPLPFISFGGSSLVISLVAMGILVNIAGREHAGAPRPLRPVST